MKTRLGRRIQTTMLIASLLMVSICTSLKTIEASTSKTDETTRTTIAKGQFIHPPEMPGVLSFNETGEATAPLLLQDTDPIAKTAPHRINPSESYFISIRTSPSAKSRTIATLKGGQPIEILEAQGTWLKITWQQGDATLQGWLKESFVEGTTIHAHR